MAAARTWTSSLGRHLASAMPVLLVGALAYANSFDVPFHLDDQDQVLHPDFRDPAQVAAMVLGVRPEGASGHSVSRSFTQLTFALNRRIGGDEPRGYHVVNLAIHLAASLVMMRLGRLSFRLATGRDGGGAVWTGLVAGLLFVAHPIQTQAVTYVVQRLASLAGLLYLSSLLLYAEARLQERPVRAASLLAGAVACALLAMRSKEIAFTLPLAVALYEWAFLHGPARRRAAFLGPMLATLPLIPLTILGVAGVDAGAATRVQTAMPRWEYLVTQLRVVVTYLRLLVLPVGLNLDHDFPASRSILEPRVVAATFVLVTLAAGGIFLLARGRDLARGWARVAGFGIAFFFLALSVESSLIPIVDVIFEHRLYLPSAGIFLAAAAGTGAAWAGLESSPVARRALAVATTAAIATMAWATHARNEVWRDEVRLWRDVARKSPGKARAHVNLGRALYDAGDSAGAKREWEVALGIDPADANAHFNLGNLARDGGDLAAAVGEWEAAVRAQPRHSQAHNQLGNVRRLENDLAGAIRAYRLAVESDRNNAEAQYNLATALEGSGDHLAAREHYSAFLRAAAPSLKEHADEVRRRLAAQGPGREATGR